MTTFNGAPIALPSGQEATGAIFLSWFSTLQALTDPWSDYSPSIAAAWTGSSSNPVAGNATISSRYIQDGKLVFWQGSIFMGTTTTFGSGTWMIAWPVTPSADVTTNAAAIGSAFFYDNSAPTGRQAGVCVSNGAPSIIFYPGGVQGVVTPTIPFTWAVSDRLAWFIVYEAA